MMKFGVSQPVRRVEDVRLLTGKGRYIDDIAPANALRAFILRSPEAHADIVSIDTAEAAAAPGVRLILTAADLEGAVENSIDYFTTENSDGSPVATPITPILATGRVRHVGQPVAAIIADTLAQARDAAELIEVEYRERPAHVATATGGPAVHDEAPDNICFDWSIGDEAATTAAFDAAAHRVTLDLIDNRVISNPMETRGATAQWDGAKLTVTINGQGVWMQKASLAKKLGLDPDHVRVINPDVGGGFGTKAFDYPEHFIVAEAARRLGQPVHWVADRSEGMVSDVSGRDHVTRMQAAFDADHRLIGLRVDCTANLGAYCSAFAQLVPGFVASRVFPGVYDVQAAFMRVIGVFTNTTPVDAYRGAGRPEAIYALERLMDYSARQLGVDPLELRRKSFIPPEKFPYTSAAGEIYDVGDFDRVLRRAEKEADLAGFAARKAQSAARGKLRGLGTCYYIESILGDQNETTKIEFAEDGMVDLYVGTQSNGQGHETVFAQILHQRAGVPFEKIRFVQGDSDRIAKGGGTGGSRSVTMQGNSINATADIMIENFMQLAEEELEAARADINFLDGEFRVVGTDRAVDIMTLSRKAREKGRVELLSTEYENVVPGRSFPNGAHLAEVEVDPETGDTRVVKYTVVDDFGVLMNPMLAEGQVHGGVAQGIGQAMIEHVVFSEDGQLLSGTFMDYGMPRADNVPSIAFHTELVPSTANEIGMKGCGEAGTVGALAAVTNAALDAVWELGVHHVDMPVTPLSMWQRIQEANARRAAE